jgi:nucleotide-binding universal stress UspA family protein
MYRHILVPTDGSPVSARAERAAVQIAKRFHSKITAIHVIAPYSPQALAENDGLGPPSLTRDEYAKVAEDRSDTLLRRLYAHARRASVEVVKLSVTDEDTGATLVRTARDAGCDLIVMGSSTRRGIERIFVGSVASDVLNGTDIPTLICH